MCSASSCWCSTTSTACCTFVSEALLWLRLADSVSCSLAPLHINCPICKLSMMSVRHLCKQRHLSYGQDTVCARGCSTQWNNPPSLPVLPSHLASTVRWKGDSCCRLQLLNLKINSDEVPNFPFLFLSLAALYALICLFQLLWTCLIIPIETEHPLCSISQFCCFLSFFFIFCQISSLFSPVTLSFQLNLASFQQGPFVRGPMKRSILPTWSWRHKEYQVNERVMISNHLPEFSTCIRARTQIFFSSWKWRLYRYTSS